VAAVAEPAARLRLRVKRASARFAARSRLIDRAVDLENRSHGDRTR